MEGVSQAVVSNQNHFVSKVYRDFDKSFYDMILMILKQLIIFPLMLKKEKYLGYLAHGAEKNTTIRMLTGAITPTSGEVPIEEYGLKENQIEAKQMMGVVSEMANAYIGLSAMRNLFLMADLYGIEGDKSLKKKKNPIYSLNLNF